jgi:hypothetical protein
MKFVLCRYYKSIRVKENKNIVIAEIPTIEDVIVEVIEYYNTEEIDHQLKFKYMIKNDLF